MPFFSIYVLHEALILGKTTISSCFIEVESTCPHLMLVLPLPVEGHS